MPPSRAYYNENDRKAAAWLRELIAAGHIAPGDVDERSIEDVLPSELAGYSQCHFFAGIGGWSYALRLAGWPDDRPVWTGSCPCQPFSAAGKGAGFADERHLWPAWFHLIRAVRPQQIFGEQVANVLAWLDLVSGDLEAEVYTSGAAIVGAHSVGQPIVRQRLYWVGKNALADGMRRERRRCQAPLAQGLPEFEGLVQSELRLSIPSGENRLRNDGLSCGRVAILRGLGNAIVPQVAAAFIAASM